MRDDALDHGLAVASLVVAVIVCAPFVTGLISVAFGLVVLGRTRQVRPLERAMAALGTSIGAVQFSVWLFALAV